MGTLPGAAPAKADLNAADQPLEKKLITTFPHTQSWARNQ
jgi:hypothetical protein